jgi:hypothetical protein
MMKKRKQEKRTDGSDDEEDKEESDTKYSDESTMAQTGSVIAKEDGKQIEIALEMTVDNIDECGTSMD